MIYRVEIENFYSVRERQVLDLTVADNVRADEEHLMPLYEGSDQRAPKIIAIYGANASGKTTLLRAIEFIAGFVCNSATPTEISQDIHPFNDDECLTKPTRLAIEVGGIINPEYLSEGAPYEMGTLRYELVVQAEHGMVSHVISETLSQRPARKIKWSKVFDRQGNEVVKNAAQFRLNGFRHLLNTLKPDASLISTFAFFTHPTAHFYAKALGSWVYTNLNVVPAFMSGDHTLMQRLKADPVLLKALNRDLSRIDLGIQQFAVEDVPNLGPQGRFTHAGHTRDLPWEMESQGTQAFVRLFPVLAEALSMGGVALVDEFDTLLHPLVLPEILRWFYDDQDRNRGGSQLWMSCHSATLLEYLTKDEVVIAEKTSQGRTHFYTLADMSSQEDKAPVRRSANLYKKYLSGALGGVPIVG
ncbi:AAA family ATPase [Asticcacaulis sp. BYS171W]|uniref:AAA family ATPase n=1 Tax=Asticcacaulis aquaticus TaxID=2984212 RepID=A0ABT5HWC4_9CAUL|nr:ATP-binding protein [Asticcacaulis aquaticus]MDC7684387.1 AAA family ATPase [Asticcacaulis aquaticus]